MARGVTLEQLLADLRAEAGHGTRPASTSSARDAQINLLNRTQEWLYYDNDWSFLRIRRDVPLVKNQALYDFPDDIDLERVETAHVKYSDTWIKMVYGIEVEDYNEFDTDLDETFTYPVKWFISDEKQFEAWPLPANDGNQTTKDMNIRFTGIKRLIPMVKESDRAILDSRLIVLYAAAEILARAEVPDANTKLELANRHYNRLRGRASKTSSFVPGSKSDDGVRQGGIQIRVAQVKS